MQWSRYNIWAQAAGRHWVHNGVSGAFIDLSEEEMHAAESVARGETIPSAPATEALLAELVAARVLIDDGADELLDLERRHRRDRQGAGGMALTIVASLGCNFGCAYCFEDKRPALLTDEVSDAVVDMIVDSQPNLEHLEVTWFGGEPLLALDQILRLSDRLIEVCDEGGTAYRATIVTNGWYLTAETARQLSARRVETAQVTIDGPEHVHDVSRPHVTGRGTYQRVLDNIEAAAAEISVAVRVNATPDNVLHLDELLADLHGRGLHDLVSLKINRVIDAPNENAPVATFDTPVFTTSEFAAVELALMDLAARYGFANPILPAPKRVACAVIAPTSVVLGPTGELWKCWDEVGHADAVFGSIFDYSAPAESLVRWHSYSPFDDEQCRSCIALPVCMGGCPHLAFEHPLREAQCGTFRFNYQARVARAARLAGGEDLPADSSHLDLLNAISSPPTVGTPVSLGPTRRGGLGSSRGSLSSRSRPI